MRCPNCGNLDDKVLESRTMVNGESIRRRRECLPASKFPVPQPDKRNVNFGEVIKKKKLQ